jgi:F-type H+-transporting ATPase subunit beta
VNGYLDVVLWFGLNQASIGIYPAIDPMRCRSRVLTSGAVPPQHTLTAQRIQESETKYREACANHSLLDAEFVRRHRLVARYLSHPIFIAAAYTGIDGASVPVARAISDANAILDGQVNVPDGAMYMIGTLDDAQRKAEKMR